MVRLLSCCACGDPMVRHIPIENTRFCEKELLHFQYCSSVQNKLAGQFRFLAAKCMHCLAQHVWSCQFAPAFTSSIKCEDKITVRRALVNLITSDNCSLVMSDNCSLSILDHLSCWPACKQVVESAVCCGKCTHPASERVRVRVRLTV